MSQESSSNLSREDFDAGPSSVDEIEPGLFLGNLSAATDVGWLKNNKISHILTIDSCPLPRKIQSLPDIKFKYVRSTDMPREDLLTYFEDCYQFIELALNCGNRILVHCYFGVSRSATIVIAYIMKRYNKSFSDAFDYVKSKRRFVGPNPGFQAQLKLYADMDYNVDNTNVQFKMYRLQIAADKVRKAKILPQCCVDLIKPDPGLITIHPEPNVYRCKKCRRIVANTSNVLPHFPHERQIWRHVSSKKYDKVVKTVKTTSKISCEQPESTEQEPCNKTYFIEPLAWMPDVMHSIEGKLNCPKCEAKLGCFSWVAGCQCPCGSKIAPAFYLVPSKVDWSNAVQNVQVTV